jgi:hypothetical protein
LPADRAVANAPASRQPAQPQHAFGSWAIAIGTIAAAVAMGVFAIKHRATEDNPAAAAQPVAAAAAAPSPATDVAPRAAAAKKSAVKTVKKAAAGPVMIVVPPSPGETRSSEPAAKRADAERPAAAAPASTETAAAAPVTITGCLEASVNDDRFRLADTEGDNAPKARSWRSGFLKKRTAPVDLIGVNPRSLEMHVGKKVSATGVLVSRELKVSSVHVVSPSCN